MPSKNDKMNTTKAVNGPSKDMPPLPEKFGPVFFENQFRTKIELPTKAKYPDVNGKCVVITGSNSGIGFEAAKHFLRLGLSHLVMGVRSMDKGNAAASKLRALSTKAKIDVWQLDMESYESIRTFVQKCNDSLPRIDVVILNAGGSPFNFEISAATGHEKANQVNHLSTAYMAIQLLPVLRSKAKQKQPPRIIIVSSITSHLCKFPTRDRRPLLPSFDDHKAIPMDASERYGASKMLNQLFIVKLADQVNPADVTIALVEPGLVKGTSLSRDLTGMIAVAAKIFFGIAGRTPEVGAATYVDAALNHGAEVHGSYIVNCKVSG